MTSNKSSRTSRKMVENYKGFNIIKVKEEHYHRNAWGGGGYDTTWVERRETHYDFCKDGNEKKPSQHYGAWASNVAECKEAIDKFIEDDSLYFTDAEREKYVYKPNHKCGWGYGYDSLMKIMKEHQKADKRMKILLEDRLDDANFHHEAGLLSKGKYDEFVEFVTKNFKFREKFEVYTETEAKRIKNPKEFEKGLAKVIEEYLASQGVKKTSVSVKFIENW